MPMTGAAIRAAFLSYFERHGHKVLPGSSLVPGNDPSLLFTNAGMVQFKEYFLGLASADWKRAATAQRCLRVSGKHNDLENVGYTARHHTLFEMLGNFSFGDYFKKDAIFFGWDFLTREMGLDGERMTVSVFREDDEAYDIWHQTMGLPASRIIRFDEKDNFWAMGPTGPCGPCSEIIFDQGEGTGCGRPSCAVGCDCDRFLEIWNLVFMQFNQDGSGARTPLPKPSIDTGMGLERLAAVVQGVKSNYDSDLFRGIIAEIEGVSGIEYGRSPLQDAATRVIADHARATAFLIADGVLPANEGRGYVLRRIMRRALRHGKKLGLDRPFLHRVAAAVVREFSSAYPDLGRSASYIDTVSLHEEKRFLETLDAGLRMVEEEFTRIGKAGVKVFAGSVAFKLYDTFGFPVDLTADLCRERDVSLDTEGFEAEMERQRAQSREAWKGGEVGVSDAAAAELARKGVSVEFVGYDRLEAGARVVALFRDGKRIMSAVEGEEVDFVTDVTPFYGEAGGQVGDVGEGTGDAFRLEITDARRPAADLVILRAKVVEGTVGEAMTVDLRVDAALRRRTQANHTATHLLQAALRKIVGPHVKQAGSYVGPDKLRFDFTHFEAVPDDALREVEDFANDAVFTDRPVSWELLPYQEAIERGAMAFFGEKYADVVRMVTVPGVSRELCGGTHVRRTGEIALFRIVSEGALAAGVRRIEALTGPEAFRHLREDADRIHRIARDLKVSPADAVSRVNKLQAQVRALEKDVQEARRRAARDLVGEVLAKAREVKGVRVVEAGLEPMDPAALRELADAVKGKLKSGLLLLGTVEEGRCHLVAGVTPDLASAYSASDIVKNAARFVGGGGGGRRDMAQAGGSNIEGFASAVSSLAAWLAEKRP
ncbi:MAG: alanyl-tRNA synthetase, alanyl-tRNA synthetase [Deltaproteobacteria bacterium CSP1-8]|nr:MAG: alanyl-tRNA synthetase, alanyl-tRNA synthetase [Deltaproteobacteria bacterium CSP1-8]